MCVTTLGRTSLPTCGLASQRISCDAPASASVCSMNLCAGLFVPVASLPSEKVPAPPRPNWMFDSGSSSPVSLKCSMAFVLRVASWPRSTRSGFSPALASESAQKRPAHPAPITIGLLATVVPKWAGSPNGLSVDGRTPFSARRARSFARSALSALVPPLRAMRAVYVKWTSLFLRASMERLRGSTDSRSSGAMRSLCSTALRSESSSVRSVPSSWSTGIRMAEMSSTFSPVYAGLSPPRTSLAVWEGRRLSGCGGRTCDHSALPRPREVEPATFSVNVERFARGEEAGHGGALERFG